MGGGFKLDTGKGRLVVKHAPQAPPCAPLATPWAAKQRLYERTRQRSFFYKTGLNQFENDLHLQKINTKDTVWLLITLLVDGGLVVSNSADFG